MYFVESIKRYIKNIFKYGFYVSKIHNTSIIYQIYDQLCLKINKNIPIDIYYSYRLYLDGRRNYAPNFTTNKYIDEVNRKVLVMSKSKKESNIIRNKYVFYKWCKENRISTAHVLAAFRDGDIEFKCWSGPSPVLPEYDLFSKNLDTWCGQNAESWPHVDSNEYSKKDGGLFSSEELVNYMKVKSEGGGGYTSRKVV